MKKKRLLALLTVLLLAVSIFPVSAFAYNAGSATITSPWYGVCTGDGVRIRSSASTSSNILGQIDRNQPIEIVGVPNSSWYKVRYDTSGSVGYIYSQYLSVAKTTYGRVLAIYGVNMKTELGGSETLMHVEYDTYMPYKNLYYLNTSSWVDCLLGRTAGWVNTSNSYAFNYEPIA